ncbi:ELMO domain-containing protein 2-like [Vespa mandarinia]|uniref:ELMO domain-containing protein 2-like n=2 Tax=Vespa TaxID=7443 RepID=UPI00161B8B79|nr:ELMO domain-containing protein 2-like [Vespa mandarinia]XP_046836808.1 ELMO domain-containing protein 2 [Vespa crabro]XP_047344109.1 ELMO domain-containing protein 2 isoform X1 [Vespa velutina]
MFLQHILSLIYWYFRPFIKWFLRQTTQMCELQRICYGQPSGAPRTLAIEESLQQSKNANIKTLITYLNDIANHRGITIKSERKILEEAIRTVLVAKNVNPTAHPDFAKSFGKCIELIWGYRQLCVECEELRKTPYDADNPEHELLLLKLWNLLMPYDPLDARVTKQWQNIGFQGDDPKTDFRGMGILGLENLVYFAQEYPSAATHVLSHSTHPHYGYAFAIVGINLTSMALKLLKDGTAKTHIYNSSKTLPTIRAFHQFYCYLFYEFDGFWIESKPSNMMEFSSIQEKFENSIRMALSNSSTTLRINVSVDNI